MDFPRVITKWGPGYAFGRDGEEVIVCVKKGKDTTIEDHPDYRGGPCVNFMIKESEVQYVE